MPSWAEAHLVLQLLFVERLLRFAALQARREIVVLLQLRLGLIAVTMRMVVLR